MSARKRHTATLDFMRLFILGERVGSFGELYGPGWREMVDKLVKRGWLEWHRPLPFQMGTFRPIMQRRNYLRSTAKGRRVIYRADRHAEPHLRAHRWGTSAGWGDMRWVEKSDQRRRDRLTKASAHARDLHGTRP